MASTPTSNRATQFAIWGAALIVLLAAVYAVRTLTRERVSVRAAQVNYQDLIKASSTNGKVEPLDDFQAHAQVAGQVQEIFVKEALWLPIYHVYELAALSNRVKGAVMHPDGYLILNDATIA